MAPPIKRRKRNIISSSPSESDSEYDEPGSKSNARLSSLVSSPPPSSTEATTNPARKLSTKSNAAAAKLQPRAKTANHPHNAAPIHLPNTRGSKTANKSASVSPEKRKRKGKPEEKGKNADIFTFFTKQAQRQQAAGSNVESTAPKRPSALKVEDFDAISDIDDIDDIGEPKAQSASFIGDVVRKRSRGADALKNGEGDTPSASQKFMKNLRTLDERKNEDDLRPWAERFAPINLEELAVHKKKVADVRAWLEAVSEGRMRQRLLILKGVAGTGKTITVQLLAKAMDCEVLEWRNPVGSVATADGFQSMAAQFEEFMGRGGKFGQLEVFSGNEAPPLKPEIKPLDRRKRLILVEEFPNTFTRSSTTLQSFRSAILQHLASNTPPLSVMYNNSQKKEPVVPVVMIISETLLTTTSASADSFTAHRLLGPEILQHPGVFSIEFNAIAPTFLAKALERIVQKESSISKRKKIPGPLVLKRLGEIGDIRSAIGSLEFLCLRGDTNGDWGSKIAPSKTKKSKDTVALTKMEEDSLELITRREASLGIFHAVGKVVYNKRDEVPPALPAEQDAERLPEFMSSRERPRRSQVSVDELIDETGTDTQTFISALHENYLLSCDAPINSYEFSSLDHVNGCIDALSDSDLICPSWDGSLNVSGFGGGTGGRGSGGDILRQDEFSFQIAVRGILFSLPYPVKRKAPAAGGLRTGKGGDAFKMFYPTSLKLWRMKEEIESTIDLWVTKMMKGEESHLGTITSGAAAFARPKAGSVESWRHKNAQSSNSKKNAEKQADSNPLMSIGTSARKEMLLERLPYMVQIARARRNSSSTLALRDMEKVTTFHGIGGPSEDSPDDADDAVVVGEEWATDKPVEGTSPRKKGRAIAIRGGKGVNALALQQPEQKLVLSDDDIEDD